MTHPASAPAVVVDDGIAPEVPPPVQRTDRRFWALLALLVLAGLFIRVDAVRNVAPPVPALGDAHAYHVLGDNLAHGRGYIRPYDWERSGTRVPTAEYPPALPVVFAVGDRVGLSGEESQRILMCGIGSLTVLLVGLATRRLAGPSAGLLAAAVAAAYPMLWAADAAAMPETLAALVGAGVLLLALRARESTSWRWWLGLGLALGAGALVRSEALFLAPILVIPLAWRMRPAAQAHAVDAAHDLDPRRRVVLGLVALVGAGIVVLPWTIRNEVTFHSFVPVSNNVGSVARGANCDLAYHGQFEGLWVTSVGDQAGLSTVDPGNACFSGFPIRHDVNEAQAADKLRSAGVHYARTHLGDLPGVVAARIGRTFGVYRFTQQTNFAGVEGRSVPWERRGTRMFQALFLLGIAGVVVLWRRRAAVWPLVAPMVVVLGTVAFTYGNQRFRAGAEPATIVLAVVALVAAWDAAVARWAPPRADPPA
ncbi:MAG TPA: glycosyltransferase family 39 protein [Acidimicrobiales bacterium]